MKHEGSSSSHPSLNTTAKSCTPPFRVGLLCAIVRAALLRCMLTTRRGCDADRHEIAESHELASHSFGKEEELPGRYSVVFKKDVAPSPDEINVIASVCWLTWRMSYTDRASISAQGTGCGLPLSTLCCCMISKW
jgi:hypothetical protein